MSINWVMLSPTSPNVFTPLPSEQTLYTSPPRATFSLQSLNKFPGQEPFHITSSSGVLYLTNRRVIYLPSNPTPQLQSFTAPILNLHDTHVTAPWIGPNVWTALVQPVQGGGIPAHHAALEIKITFKEGGAYDFQTTYERIRERLQHAVSVARESGTIVGDGSETGRGMGAGALSGVNVGNVHLEDLPAYEETGRSVQPPSVVVQGVEAVPTTTAEQSQSPVVAQQTYPPPNEPPPGYDEVQREAVEDELERRLSEPLVERQR